MSSTRVLRGLILGALGGLIGWAIVEAIPYLTTDPPPGQPPAPVDPAASGILGAIIGLWIGLGLGVSEGIAAGTKTKFLRAAGLGALFGVAGGLVGLMMGQTLYNLLGGSGGTVASSLFDFFRQILARSLGWGLIGTGVGLSVGIPTQSPRKIWHGFVGGTIGGLLGGFCFQTLGSSRIFVGENLRMIGFTAIGGSVGFFVSLVDEALKQAWVRVLVGRNEGREHILDKSLSVLGRDELAEVPLFGDPAIARQHAIIERVGSRRVLRDQGTPSGTLVNGQRVAEAILRDGDRIQIGSLTIVFYEKATASHLRRPVDAPRSSAPRPPSVPANVCPFCGAAKDPVTGACACSVAEPVGGGLGSPHGVGSGSPPSPPIMGGVPVSPADAPPIIGGPGGLTPTPLGGLPFDTTPRLVVVGGPHAGQSFSLVEETIAIGRDASLPVAFPGDATTSRRHAVITRENGAFVLRDQGSTNGTFLNGQRVVEHVLGPGDQIQIGANQLQVEF